MITNPRTECTHLVLANYVDTDYACSQADVIIL